MKTKLNYYRYDVSKPEQREAYAELCETLSGMGLKVFDSIASNHSTLYKETIKPLDGQEITLETSHLFDNQWNTAPTPTSEKGMRIFDWAEAIYPNKGIKEGQWLEQTPAMSEIRRNTNKCGYCGKQEPAAKGYVFCPHCLDSEYLEENQLHLTRMVPIYKDWAEGARPELTKAERAHLLPLYKEAQSEGHEGRRLNKIQKQRKRINERYRETLEEAETEYKAYSWLLDHEIDIDNVIYYKHTDRFCFGWRNPLTDEQKSDLLDVLCEFQFDYDFK